MRDLKLTLEAYQRARTILVNSGNDDPDVRRKLFSRLAVVELEMTWPCEELREKERHIDNAEEFIKAAGLEAQRTTNEGLIDYVNFERSCIQARRLRLKARQKHDKREMATKLDTAVQALETAMRRLEISNLDIFMDSREYGKNALDRLNDLKSRSK